MKNRTCLSLIFTFLLLNTFCLKANSWENPKEMETLRYHIDTKINALQKEKAKKQTKLEDSNTHISDKQKDKIAAAIKDLDSRLVELNTSKADIERLGNDTQHVYTFSNFGENCVIKINEKKVKIQGADDALLIHEIRHISLWLQTGRNFRFSKSNLLMPIFAGGSVDELYGYRAQYAFAPNSLPGQYPADIEHVNIAFIEGIKYYDGTYAYPSIRKMSENDLKIASNKPN